MTDYEDLWEEEQVDLLREVAVAAAPAYGLDPDSATLVAHAYNTTFALDGGPTGRAAVRVGTNSHSTLAHVRGQHAWIRSLHDHGVAVVAEPLRTVDGADVVEVPGPGGGALLVTAADWLDGPDVEDFDDESVRELGEVMARMHSHASGFALPDGATLPVFEEPLFGDDNVLATWPTLAGEGLDVVREAFARTGARFAELFAGADMVPVHGDLHAGNLKRTPAGLAVFDFDDMGWSLPVLDLAITTFYLDEPAHEDLLREAYARVRPLPEVLDEQFQALVAARQLLLANSLLESSTASLRTMAEDYVGVTVDRLRHWLDTGRFTRSLPAG